MFIFGNFFVAAAMVLDMVLNAYMWVIIIAAVISWVSPDPYNPIVRILHSLTEPVLRPIRRRIGAFGGIDISPMIVILAIVFLRYFLVQTLIQMGRKM